MRKMIGEIEPIVANISSHYIHEGTASQIVRATGESEKTVMTKHSGFVEIPTVALEQYTYQDVLDKLREMAIQFAEGASRQIIATISEGAEKSGNVVDGKGKPLSPEVLLETLSVMSHSFDPDGQWNAPTIVLTSQQMERLTQLHQEQSYEEKSQYESRVADIVRDKKAEHDSEQARRILAG